MSTAALTRSADIALALREEVLADGAALRAAVAAYGDAVHALWETTDIVAAMRAAAGLALAAEGVEAAASAVAELARAKLAAVMLDTGAAGIATDTHRVAVHEGRRGVLITDPAAVPAEYMTTPEPRPDKAAILKALTAGQAIPGCSLSNGGAPFLSFHSRKGAP